MRFIGVLAGKKMAPTVVQLFIFSCNGAAAGALDSLRHNVTEAFCINLLPYYWGVEVRKNFYIPQ